MKSPEELKQELLAYHDKTGNIPPLMYAKVLIEGLRYELLHCMTQECLLEVIRRFQSKMLHADVNAPKDQFLKDVHSNLYLWAAKLFEEVVRGDLSQVLGIDLANPLLLSSEGMNFQPQWFKEGNAGNLLTWKNLYLALYKNGFWVMEIEGNRKMLNWQKEAQLLFWMLEKYFAVFNCGTWAKDIGVFILANFKGNIPKIEPGSSNLRSIKYKNKGGLSLDAMVLEQIFNELGVNNNVN